LGAGVPRALPRPAFVLLLLAAILLWTPFSARSQEKPSPEVAVEDQVCLSCHGKQTIAGVTPRGKMLDLYVITEVLEESVHKGIACRDCHGGAKTFLAGPHNEGNPLELLCANCHEKENKEYHQSIHGIWHDHRGST